MAAITHICPNWPLLTFDLYKGHCCSNQRLVAIAHAVAHLTSKVTIVHQGLIMVKFGTHNNKSTHFDIWPIKVIIVLNLHQGFIWPTLAAIAHALVYLSPVDLWHLWRSSLYKACSRGCMTAFGTHSTHLNPFDLCEGHHCSKRVSGVRCSYDQLYYP